MEQALEDSGISIAPLERPHASNTHHMPPPPSILGARTRHAEHIAKEAENAPSSEKSSSTESSSTESSLDEVEDETNSKSSAKSSDINSSCADNSNMKMSVILKIRVLVIRPVILKIRVLVTRPVMLKMAVMLTRSLMLAR